jgi:hypothetical protein
LPLLIGGSGLKQLAWLLGRESSGGELRQFAIHEGQLLVLGVPGDGSFDQAGGVRHVDENTPTGRRPRRETILRNTV